MGALVLLLRIAAVALATAETITLTTDELEAMLAAAAAGRPPAAADHGDAEQIAWVRLAEARKSPKPDFWFLTDPSGNCPPCKRAAKLQNDPRVVRWSRHFDCVKVRRVNGLEGFPYDVFVANDRSRRIVYRGAAPDANTYAWRFAVSFEDLVEGKTPRHDAPAVATQPVAVKARGYPLRPRASWWTHPGDLRAHLSSGQHARHGFDVRWLAHLSPAELESLHSDCHEGRVDWTFAVRF